MGAVPSVPPHERTRALILVTGAAGLLGREVVRILAGRGGAVRAPAVRAIDLVPNPDRPPTSVQHVVGDLVDAGVCRDAVQGVQAVVHAAAVQFHSPGRPRFQIEPYFRRNVEMTRRLLDASVEAGVERFVFVSSDMVYGPPRELPLREGAATRPVGPYGRSKVACEGDCRAAHGGIPEVTILRPCVIVGPGRLGLLRTLFDRVRAHRAIPLLGDGSNRHHLVAVDDVAEACRLALEHGGGGTFNIGSQEPATVRDLMGDLCRRAGSRSRLVPLPAGPGQLGLGLLWSLRLSTLNPEQFRIAPLDYVLDTTAARDDLGFEARHHDTDSLFATYRWYVEGGAGY
jgi:dTDP-glucose 4,6-dehydratase